jgi:membrane associated rhomboid family serine protease
MACRGGCGAAEPSQAGAGIAAVLAARPCFKLQWFFEAISVGAAKPNCQDWEAMVFFQENRRSREPFLNAPATVLWLIGAIVAAHVLRVLLPDPWPDAIILQFGFIPVRYAGAAAAAAAGLGQTGVLGLAVPFVSYIFIHGGLAHLAINSVWLLAFGPMAARRLKTLRFLIFFFACGIAAALFHLVAYWGSVIPVVGASGAISGLMAGGMRILYGAILSGGHVRDAPLAPVFSRPILVFSALWVVGNAVSGILGFGVTDDVTTIAWVAHLGGYFAGLVLIGPIDRLPWGARGVRLI